MKRQSRERPPLYSKILFAFTDHPITVWGGVIMLRLYFEWIALRKELGKVLVPFAKRSNNQIAAEDVLLSWSYGLGLGAERFEHFTRYRRDNLIDQLLGVSPFSSPDTLRRLRAVREFVFLVGADLISQGGRSKFVLPCPHRNAQSFSGA